jgi:dolichyl-phosphate beta-glucosyltransferase
MLLSIIFPAHNEEHRLPAALEQTFAFLKTQPYESEVIVVENGSSDRTLEIAQDFASRHSNLRVIHEERRGKGLAVRTGMLAATGEYRMFCDVDLSMPIGEVSRFIPPALSNVDIAIASREAGGAVRYNEPAYRHLVGRAFTLLVRVLALPGLQDSQCGFKCFRAAVAEELFPLQTISGWTFDVEVLFIANRRGYKIVEIPIPWYFNPESKVNIKRDLAQVLRELWWIRRNAWNKKYQNQPGSTPPGPVK